MSPRPSIVLIALILVPPLVFAQGPASLEQGLAALEGGDRGTAVHLLYEVAASGTSPGVKSQAQFHLARGLEGLGLPVLAASYHAQVVRAGSAHPFYLEAVERLIAQQAMLNDSFLISSQLAQAFHPSWAQLSEETFARARYLVASIQQRKGNLREARLLLEAVPQASKVHPAARYLLGVVLSDSRYPGGPQSEAALRAFQDVLAVKDAPRDVRELALLGVGRLQYGLQRYPEAEAAYAQVSQRSRFWDQSLLERAFARFQADDAGGALGALQTLHAPQFVRAFQPESWILAATVYYFNCLYDESRAALKSFEERYLPMADALEPLLENHPPETYYQLIAADSARVPRPVWLWVRSNERVLGVLHMLEQIEGEKVKVAQQSNGPLTPMGKELQEILEDHRQTVMQVLAQLVKNRLEEVHRNIRAFAEQAAIIRFESSKGEKELAEAGVDQSRLLAQQALHRPKMPARSSRYWAFQGEFWRDELGKYRYTLKRGCSDPAKGP